MNILFFDTETVGLPKDYKAPITDVENWPRMVQIAWMLMNENGDPLTSCSAIIRPNGFTIPEDVAKIHNITTEIALEKGEPIGFILSAFLRALEDASIVVGHNISFDRKIVGAELIRLGYPDGLSHKPRICTMMKSTNYCQLQGKYGYKWPKLEELHLKLFGIQKEGLHDAMEDVKTTVDCFFELTRLGVITDEDMQKAVENKKVESF